MANYFGTTGNDTAPYYRGTSASDNFFGSGGSDTIIGGGGDDTLVYGPSGTYGGISGTINITFNSSPSSSLYSGTVGKSIGGTDTFTGIRGVNGTSGDDHFVGTTLPSTYNSFAIFFRGGAGNDYMDGRNNAENQANYRDAPIGVTIDLGASSDANGDHTGTASDGQGGTDTLFDVVRVRGGNSNDRVFGSSLGDIFDASLGSDTYDGRGGSNILTYNTPEFSGNLRTVTVIAGAPTAGLYGLGTASVMKYFVADGSIVGADTATNVNQFRGSDGADTLIGTTEAYSFFSYRLQGAAGNDTIYGQNLSINRADYASASSAVSVDLAAGTAQDGQGGTDTLIGVRGVQASSYNDTLLGGYQSDVFVVGSSGQHTINGRGGANAVYYTGSDNVTIDLGTTATTDGYGGYLGSITKSAGTDTLANVANAQGGSGNDTIRGTPGANQLEGGSGNNTIDGRDGYDTVNYQYFSGLDTPTHGATVNLNDGVSGTATNPWGGTDMLLSIEGVSGSQFDDDLTGAVLASGASSYVQGYGGNDTIRAPSDGTHVTADYQSSLSAVYVNLGAGVAYDDGWFSGHDTLVHIQAVRGSSFGDTLVGSSLADTISGGSGNDQIRGGAGADILDGGHGFDTAYFSGTLSNYTITAGNGVGHPVQVTGPDGTDSLVNIEKLLFDDGTSVTATHTFSSPAFELAAFGAAPAGGSWTSNDIYPRELADVNGDGRSDIVAFGEAGVYVSLANSDGSFGAANKVLSAFGHDPSAGSWTDNTTYPRELADVNGDGRSDIVAFGNAGVFVALANTSGGFDAPQNVLAAFGNDPSRGGWTSNDTYPREMADVNGDGLSDIVAFGNAGVFVALATGDGKFADATNVLAAFGNDPSRGGWTSNTIYPRELADVNSDGRADIVAFGEAGVYVSLATSGGTFTTPNLVLNAFGHNASAGGWSSNDIYPRQLADVNGDGLADIVAFGEAGAFVALGNGTGGFNAPTLDLAAFGRDPSRGGWTSQDKFPRLLGDIDGDHTADIVAFGNAGVYTSHSDYHLV